MPKADVNGIALRYDVEGSGPPLLLLAGMGANRLSWAATTPALRDDFTVITFDMRGTGESDVPPGPYTIDLLADDVAGLIDHLDLGPVAAVGLSMGGAVLQSVLVRHPDRVSRAVLLSTVTRWSELVRDLFDAVLALRALDLPPAQVTTTMVPWFLTPRTLSDHVRTKQLVDAMAQDPLPTGNEPYAAFAAAYRAFDSREDLHRVTTPTLVLVGAEDIGSPPSEAIEIARRIPDARLVVMPRGGHLAIFEYPDDTLAEITGFLSAPAYALAG